MNVSSGRSQATNADLEPEGLSAKSPTRAEAGVEAGAPSRGAPHTGAFILNPAEEFRRMVQRQTLNRWYNRNMKSLKQRIKIIFGLMQKVCKILELQISTFCLSVNIFDAIVSKFPVEKPQMVPLGLIAVVLASKMNETHDKVISLSDIARYIIPFDVKFLAKMERKAFSVLGFQLNMVLPQSFISFLLHQFLSDKTHFFSAPPEETPALTSSFLKVVNYLNLLTVVDYTFYKYTSVAVAVSVIVYARRLLGLEDVWPGFLEEFTGISLAHVEECISLIDHRYQEKFLPKVFEKIDAEHECDALDRSQFLNPSFVDESTYKISEQFFMDNEVVSKYVESLKTMDSFRKPLSPQ